MKMFEFKMLTESMNIETFANREKIIGWRFSKWGY